MTASMTACCRVQSDQTAGTLTWEIRSVNHRYLDVHLRLPEELRGLESPAREVFQKHFGRGRIDATLRFDPGTDHNPTLAINMQNLAALGKAIEVVSLQVPGAGPSGATDILRWPGILDRQEIDLDSLGEAALNALNEAVSELASGRKREGDRLLEINMERVDNPRTIAAD